MSSLSKIRSISEVKQLSPLSDDLSNLDDHQQEIDEIRGTWMSRLQQEHNDNHGEHPAAAKRGNDRPYLIQYAQGGDDGDSDLYIECNRDDTCHDAKTGIYYQYVGPNWVADYRNDSLKDGVDKVINKYHQLATELHTEGSQKHTKLIKNIIKKIKRLQTLPYKKNVREQACCGRGGLSIKGDEWDRDPYALSCVNGVVDIRIRECHDGRPDQYLRKSTGQYFDKNAGPPKVFLQYLSESLRYTQPPPKPEDYQLTEDPQLFTEEGKERYEADRTRWENAREAYTPELIAFLQRLLGYSILGEVREHIFVLLYGKGRNGKSILAEIISHVLGDYAGAIQPEMLLSAGYGKSSSGPSPDMMDLEGKRAVIASETNDGNRLESSVVKRLSGADEIIARAPYDKEMTRFSPTYTLFLVTNNLPAIPADDYALVARLVPIHFGVSFVENPDLEDPAQGKIDKDLLKKLKQEASAILNWLVEGYIKYAQEGLNIPYFIKETTQQYQRDNDVLGHFIEDSCEVTKGVTISGKYLYACYEAWCKQNGHMKYSHTKFGEKMKLRFEKYRDKHGIRYRGINSIYLEENPSEEFRR